LSEIFNGANAGDGTSKSLLPDSEAVFNSVNQAVFAERVEACRSYPSYRTSGRVASTDRLVALRLKQPCEIAALTVKRGSKGPKG